MTGIRHFSGSYGTRVVIELSGEAEYRTSTRIGPDRLVIDIPGGLVRDGEMHEVGDPYVRRIRLNQLRSGAQVVLDLRRPQRFEHFTLAPDREASRPHRIVLDVGQTVPDDGPADGAPTPLPPRPEADTHEFTRRDSGASGPIVVVIDPGHGGDDPGASASRDLREKHITLEVSRALYQRLRREPGVNPKLTRDRDKTLSLADRQKMVEDLGGDLLVSIHANSSPNKKADGAEVFYLSLRSSQAASRRDASASGGDLERILSDLDHAEGMFLSGRLAREVSVELDRVHSIRVRKVRQAGFQVLKLDGIPAVLVELGFLSNPKEAQHLMDPRYPEEAAEHLAQAILIFARDHLAAPMRITTLPDGTGGVGLLAAAAP